MEEVKQEFETKVILVDRIHPNTWNKGRAPSLEFIESIRKNGVLQSILVRPVADETGEYEIIAGERRWKGAKQAGLAEIECRVVQVDDAQAQELTLIENFDRDDLTPIEVAQRIAELLEIHHGDVREVAARVGRSRAFVASRRNLAGLDLSLFGKDVNEIPISCLELIAKMPPHVQQELAQKNEWVLQDYQRLRDFLAEVEKLFGDTRRDCACCYDFTLGKFPNGWRFNVVNDWHKWMDAGREHEFGNYQTPEAAVQAFLQYVKSERINPAGLTHQ